MSAAANIAQRQAQQAEAIQALRKAAAQLDQLSEQLRAAIDDMETKILIVSGTNCAVSDETVKRLLERVQSIRRLRNTMETFELKCRTEEAMAKAWEALP